MPVKRLNMYGETPSLQFTVTPPDFSSSSPASGPFYLNGYFESYKTANEERKLAFCKRPGIIRAVDAGLSGLTGITNNYKVQGIIANAGRTAFIFYANNTATNKAYFFDGTTLTDKGVCPAAAGAWTASGAVRFTLLDGISYGSGAYYAATDLTKGAIIDNTGTWTEITDADFTGLNKVTNFCAMDGYLFIGTSNNRIYNSELNAATNWIATSFLTAADTPGSLLWLARLRNYLVAFKQNSIEFFEDTGNPTPGSPLTPQKQLNKKIGILSTSSIKEVSDGIIFLGCAPGGKASIYKLKMDDLSLEIISNQYIEQLLTALAGTNTGYSVDPCVTSVTTKSETQVLNYKDKEWYAICLKDSSQERTYIYDNGLKNWTQWASCVTGNNILDQNFTPWQSFVFVKDSIVYNLMVQNFLSGASAPPYFVAFYLNATFWGDSVSASSSSVYGYPMIWVSDLYDFGTRNRKFLDHLEILYDTRASDNDTAQTITLYYADSDYNTTSPNRLVTRTKSISNNTSRRAIFWQLGSFRKRWFAIKQVDTTNFYPFRIWGVELDYNDGETDQEG